MDRLGFVKLNLKRTRTPDKFTEQDLGPLIDFIKSNVKVVDLNLSNHDLGKREMQCLLRSLHGLLQLERINLKGNKMPAAPRSLWINLLKKPDLVELRITLEKSITSEEQFQMFLSDMKEAAQGRIKTLKLELSSDSVDKEFLVPVQNMRIATGTVRISVAP